MRLVNLIRIYNDTMKRVRANRTRRRRRTRTRNGQRQRQTGGKFMGKGAFGAVYADPRFPCQGESYEDVVGKKEVSKFFNDSFEAEREYEVVEQLRVGFSEAELNELRNYTILPKQLCIATQDPDVARHFTSEWFKDANGRIPRGAPTRVEELMGDPMVISEKGSHNLYNEFNNIRTFLDVKKTLQGMGNILKGIQTLVNKKYCHFDMKLENCITMETDADHPADYRLIDMADVFNFIRDSNLDTLEVPSTAFMYPVHCPDTIMASYLIDPNEFTTTISHAIQRKLNLPDDRLESLKAVLNTRFNDPNASTLKTRGMNINPQVISVMYVKQADFNNAMYPILMNQFVRGLSHSNNKTHFSEEDKRMLEKMETNIRNYRFLHASSTNYNTHENYFDLFKRKFLNQQYYYTREDQEKYGLTNTIRFLRCLNQYYSRFKTKEQLAEALIPYLMLYSFSSMLFEVYHMLVNQRTVYQEEYADEYRDLTKKLLGFLHKTMRGGIYFKKLDESSDVSAFNQMCEYYYSELMV